jgi:hypothetical protein
MRGLKMLSVSAACLALVGGAIAIGAMPSSRPALHEGPSARSQLPVSFVENRGQTDAAVRYYAQGNRYAFYMTPSEVLMSFVDRAPSSTDTESPLRLALGLRFINSDPLVEPQGADQAPGLVNDLRGSDPTKWHTGIPHFRDVVYNDLWAGIDLRVREQSGVLKYEFHVAPDAAPSDVQLAYAGAESLAVGADGDLQIHTALGTLQDSAPVSYQDIDGARVPVSSRYVVGDTAATNGRFTFEVGEYQKNHELIIDPGVQFTTFLGGNSDEDGNGIAVDANGNSFIAGTTQSPDFPTTVGAFRRTGAAQNFADAFVSKLNAAGTALIYSTFVGGSNMEFGNSLAVDSAGNAYVTGTTKSSNFPTTGNAFDRTLNTPGTCPRCGVDNTDGFVFKLNAAGSALVYSTYLGGGSDIDSPRGIAVDGGGNAYVVGETNSIDFPTTAGAFSRSQRGDGDMFVTKLNSTGSALVYSTYLGGTTVDNGANITVDSAGNAYALGFSRSVDFPTTAGAFDTTANGAFDVTLTKVNPGGSALVYSTYLGGSDFDSAGGLAIDGAGNAYVAGGTPSADWPTTPGAYDRTFNNTDAFVTKLNPAGSALVYSTFIGGSDFDSVAGIVLDSSANAWLTGNTSSADFPVTAGAPDTTFNGGGSDALIAELNATGTALPFATFLGGTNSEGGIDIARDSVGDVYVVGSTSSQDFPATVGAFDRVFNGDQSIFWGDAFVSKLDIDATSSTPVSPPGVPAAPILASPPNASSQPQPIQFDWNDVAQAVSYQIQIDDSSAFTAPLVRDQNVTSSFLVVTGLASSTHWWRVRAVNSAGQAGAWSTVRTVIPQTAPPPAQLSTIDLNPTTVEGGTSSAGTVVTDVSATDGAVISLSSSNPAVASVPPTTTVPPNGFAGTFEVTTSAVSATTTATITATYNGSSRSATLTITPAGAGVTLNSVTISPSSVAGGNNTSGFVSLSAGAPAGGAVVALSSSDPAVASLPSSVTVGAGSTAWGFTVVTSAVSTTRSLTISATYNGITRTAALTVTAATPPPPPPQNVTVTVSATGRSGETVVSTPAGVSVASGTTGSAQFAAGTSVTLRVSSGRDVIWSGACSSGGNKTKTCTFTANANASVTANIQ